MLKLKLQYFGHLMWRADSFEKDPDAGKDWRQEEKGTTEDETVGWHHRCNGHEFGWTPGVGDGQGGLVYCGSWGCEESDMTEQLSYVTHTDMCIYTYYLPLLIQIHVPQCHLLHKASQLQLCRFPRCFIALKALIRSVLCFCSCLGYPSIKQIPKGLVWLFSFMTCHHPTPHPHHDLLNGRFPQKIYWIEVMSEVPRYISECLGINCALGAAVLLKLDCQRP